jgi:hypothetical protein
MALGSTQPLAETSTRNIYWGVNAVGALRLTILPLSCSDLRGSNSWNLLDISRPLYGLPYLYHYSKPRVQICQETKFFSWMVTCPMFICGSSVRELLNFILLTSGIARWLIIIIITATAFSPCGSSPYTSTEKKLIEIYINETVIKYSTNNTKHSKYKYAYYQNTHTIVQFKKNIHT